LKATKLSENSEIIIIDDCSDQLTNKYLKEISKKMDIKLFRNDKNSGFIKSCNRGIDLAKNEITILLNSDTKVPENFEYKVLSCFNSDSNIAIASPISTHSGWFNIPENELYDYRIINSIADKFSPTYPLFTPEGFCLCLRKSIALELKKLDEIYGMGYCEEDDLVMKAIQKSYKTVLIDNLVVYHKRHASFTSEGKKVNFNKNRKIFEERWGNKQGVVRNQMRVKEIASIISEKINIELNKINN
jgi:GT2 family glycosyltransferase